MYACMFLVLTQAVAVSCCLTRFCAVCCACGCWLLEAGAHVCTALCVCVCVHVCDGVCVYACVCVPRACQCASVPFGLSVSLLCAHACEAAGLVVWAALELRSRVGTPTQPLAKQQECTHACTLLCSLVCGGWGRRARRRPHSVVRPLLCALWDVQQQRQRGGQQQQGGSLRR